jgi:hypothetical protein
VTPLSDGDAVCADLVQYCAAPAAALGEPYQGCYETGMRGKAPACLDAEACVTSCHDAGLALPPPGDGGAAGAAGASGAAAGESETGGAAGAAGATLTSEAGAGGTPS